MNIFKRKQTINNQLSAEIRALKDDMNKTAQQYEVTRQQLVKNFELMKSIGGRTR